MSVRKQERESRWQLFGWVIFLGCSIFFILSSVIDGGPWTLIAGVLFFLGCVIFLIPFIWKKE